MLNFEEGTMVRGQPIVLNNGDYLLPMYYETGEDREMTASTTCSYFMRYNPRTKVWTGATGDDDGDGNVDWIDPQTMRNPDPQELTQDDDIAVLNFVDRGNVQTSNSQTYQKYAAMINAMIAALGQTNVSRISLNNQQGVDGFQIDLGGGAIFRCLAANDYVRDRTSIVQYVNTENERSLCFLLQFGGFHYIVGGDVIGRDYNGENARIEEAIGEYIDNNGINIDVLQVNHHGGNNTCDDQFLAYIAPEIAIISVGNRNTYQHPNGEALGRLVNAGVNVIYQTEWGTTTGAIPDNVRRCQAIFQGDIIITTDGNTYDITTQQRFNADG